MAAKTVILQIECPAPGKNRRIRHAGCFGDAGSHGMTNRTGGFRTAPRQKGLHPVMGLPVRILLGQGNTLSSMADGTAKVINRMPVIGKVVTGMGGKR